MILTYINIWLLLGIINLFIYKKEFDSVTEELNWLDGYELVILSGYLLLIVFSPYYFAVALKAKILKLVEMISLQLIRRKVRKILKKEKQPYKHI